MLSNVKPCAYLWIIVLQKIFNYISIPFEKIEFCRTFCKDHIPRDNLIDNSWKDQRRVAPVTEYLLNIYFH